MRNVYMLASLAALLGGKFDHSAPRMQRPRQPRQRTASKWDAIRIERAQQKRARRAALRAA